MEKTYYVVRTMVEKITERIDHEEDSVTTSIPFRSTDGIEFVYENNAIEHACNLIKASRLFR